jgi:hypothetical protein
MTRLKRQSWPQEEQWRRRSPIFSLITARVGKAPQTGQKPFYQGMSLMRTPIDLAHFSKMIREV